MGDFSDKLTGQTQTRALRLVRLGDLPVVRTNKSGGEHLIETRRALSRVLKEQGHNIDADKIDPFQAEPCAVAVLLATADEIEGLQYQLQGVLAVVRDNTAMKEVEAAVTKILEKVLPELHGRIEGIERDAEEASENAQRAWLLASKLAQKMGVLT